MTPQELIELADAASSWTARPDGAHGWKSVDVTSGDDVLHPIDPDKKVVVEENPEPGSNLILVRTEDIWASDPETGTASILMHQNAYLRKVSAEEQAEILSKLQNGTMTQNEMSQHFN